jgi:hypothetical protein
VASYFHLEAFTVEDLTKIYQLNHKQDVNGEELLNIYFFRNLGTGTDAHDLSDAFISDLQPLILDLQVPNVVTTEIKAFSLGNFADFWVEPENEAGTADPTDPLPIFNAINYTLRPTTREIRPGSKRIAGIPESVTTFNNITFAAYLTSMEALRVAFGTPIGTDPDFFELVVVKRIKYEVPDSDPVRFAYRLPETDEEAVVANLGAVLTTPRISHQVSRGG